MPSRHSMDHAYRDAQMSPYATNRERDYEYDDRPRPRKHRQGTHRFSHDEVDLRPPPQYGFPRERYGPSRRQQRSPPVPFDEAVHELNITLKESTNTLTRIAKGFEDDTRGVRPYADEETIDMLWRSKLKGSGPKRTNTKNSNRTDSSQQQQYDNGDPQQQQQQQDRIPEGKRLEELITKLSEKLDVVKTSTTTTTSRQSQSQPTNSSRRSSRIRELTEIIAQRATIFGRRFNAVFESYEDLVGLKKALNILTAELGGHRELWDKHDDGSNNNGNDEDNQYQNNGYQDDNAGNG